MRQSRTLLSILLIAGVSITNSGCSGSEDPANKWGYIDKSGGYVIAPQYDQASVFQADGTAVVLEGKNLRQLDRKTQKTSNLPAGANGSAELPPIPSAVAVRVGDLWGLKDASGKMIFDPTKKDEDTKKLFPFGLACAEFHEHDGIAKSYGYITPEGKIGIEPNFEAARNFGDSQNSDAWAEGIVKGEQLAAVKSEGKWGYIDDEGNTVINAQFSEAGDFAAGLAPVKVYTPEPLAMPK